MLSNAAMLFFKNISYRPRDKSNKTDSGLVPIQLDGDVSATLSSPSAMLRIFDLQKFKLPRDVILRIIDVGTFDSGDIEDYMLFPLRMSHVCKTWRDLVLNTSRLWNTIAYKGAPKLTRLPLVRGNKIPPTDYYPLICLFLKRSEDRLINIHLDLRQPNHDFSVDERDVSGRGHPLDNLLRVFKPHAPRIKTFTFITNTWIDVIQLRYHIYTLKMPNLERFELTRAHLNQTFRPYFRPRPLFERVPFCVEPIGKTELMLVKGGTVQQDKWPKVKHVVLVGIPMAWKLWSFYNLTSLKLNYLAGNALLSSDSMRHILRALAPVLKHLEIHGSSPLVNNVDLHEQVELPCLQTLSIGFSRTAQVTWLIKTLITPALTSLEIVDLLRCYSQYCRQIERMEPEIEPSTRDVNPLCKEMLENMPFPLDKITHLTLRYLNLSQLGGKDYIPAAGTDDASKPPAARFLLSLSALNTLTLESTDFERLANYLFRNSGNPPERKLRTLEVLTCFPWRRGFDEENRGVESKAI